MKYCFYTFMLLLQHASATCCRSKAPTPTLSSEKNVPQQKGFCSFVSNWYLGGSLVPKHAPATDLLSDLALSYPINLIRGSKRQMQKFCCATMFFAWLVSADVVGLKGLGRAELRMGICKTRDTAGTLLPHPPPPVSPYVIHHTWQMVVRSELINFPC